VPGSAAIRENDRAESVISVRTAELQWLATFPIGAVQRRGCFRHPAPNIERCSGNTHRNRFALRPGVGLRAARMIATPGGYAMPTAVTTVIAAISASAAVGSLLVYVHFVRCSDKNAAREEALALAETRAGMIRELRARLAALDRRHKQSTAAAERHNYELRRALEKARRRIHEQRRALEKARVEAAEQAYRAQQLHDAAVVDLLEDLLIELEATPPNVQSALLRIRTLLNTRPAA
jgi:hypothetical protein